MKKFELEALLNQYLARRRHRIWRRLFAVNTRILALQLYLGDFSAALPEQEISFYQFIEAHPFLTFDEAYLRGGSASAELFTQWQQHDDALALTLRAAILTYGDQLALTQVSLPPVREMEIDVTRLIRAFSKDDFLAF